MTENGLVLKLTAALKVGLEMRKAQKEHARPWGNITLGEVQRLQTAFDLRLAALKGDGVNLDEKTE